MPPLRLFYICMYCWAFEFEKWHCSHVHRLFFFFWWPDKWILLFLIIFFVFQRFFSVHVLIPSKIVPVSFEIVSSPRCRLGQEMRTFRKFLHFERLVCSRLHLWYSWKFCIEYIHHKIIRKMLCNRVWARIFRICQGFHFDFCQIKRIGGWLNFKNVLFSRASFKFLNPVKRHASFFVIFLVLYWTKSEREIQKMSFDRVRARKFRLCQCIRRDFCTFACIVKHLSLKKCIFLACALYYYFFNDQTNKSFHTSSSSNISFLSTSSFWARSYLFTLKLVFQLRPSRTYVRFQLVTISNFPQNSYLTVHEQRVQWCQISKYKQTRFLFYSILDRLLLPSLHQPRTILHSFTLFITIWQTAWLYWPLQ